MGLPIPSKEFINELGVFFKEQFSVWLKVVKNPISVISNCDPESSQSFIESARFALFVYALVIFVALPGLVLFYKANIKNPIFFIVDFISYGLILLTFGAMLHLSAKIMFAKGWLSFSLLASGYLAAFWPILQMTDYLLLPSPHLRASVTGENVSEVLPVDIIVFFMLLVLLPSIAWYLIAKTVPVVKHIYSVGTIRAAIISLLAFGMLVIVSQLAFLPIMQESIKL